MFNREEFVKQLEELERHKQQLLHGRGVAGRFLSNSEKRLNEIDDQIQIIHQFLDAEGVENTILPPDSLDERENKIFEIHPRRRDLIQQMTVKEKKALLKEAEEEREAKEESVERVTDPNQPQQPQQPRQPNDFGKTPIPEQQKLLTLDERKDAIRKKLSERDPRKMKEGLTELKKPENKDLTDDDPAFSKLIKNAEGKVNKYDKIQDSMRRNLKTLMQSASDVVKMRIADLRAGRIGAGVVGLKEISNSASFGNEVAGAANKVVNGVKELYKEFDIKPEEALSKELLEEARPIFTREMSEKSVSDRDIDLHSRQNKLWGDTKEITDEELETLKKIKELTGTDKLPPVAKKEDMKLVKDIVTEIAKNPQGRGPVTTIIAKGKEM